MPVAIVRLLFEILNLSPYKRLRISDGQAGRLSQDRDPSQVPSLHIGRPGRLRKSGLCSRCLLSSILPVRALSRTFPLHASRCFRSAFLSASHSPFASIISCAQYTIGEAEGQQGIRMSCENARKKCWNWHFALYKQDAAVVVDGFAVVVTAPDCPVEAHDHRDRAIDLLCGLFLVRLDVSCRISTDVNVIHHPA